MAIPAKEQRRRRELLATVLVAGGLVAVLAAWLPAGTAHLPPEIQLHVTARDNGVPCSLDGGDCWFEIEKNGEPLSGDSPDLPLERGATVEVTLENDAGNSFDHSFEVGTGGDQYNDGRYGGSRTISPGETDTFTFQVPWETPDEALYWCDPHGSAMDGTTRFDGSNAAPTLTVDSPRAGANVRGEVEISGTAGDADGDAVTVEVQVPPGQSWQATDGGDAWTLTWDSSRAADGDHTIRVRAVDQHGSETLVERAVTVDNPQPPSIGIDRPAEGAQVTGEVTVEGNASDPEGDVRHVEVQLPPADAWRTAEGTTDWSIVWNTTGLQPGTHTLRARAVDAEGLTAATNVTVEVVGSGRPRVTVTAPVDGATVDGVVAVNGTAEAPEGELSRVEVRVDGGPWRTANGTATWNATVRLAPGDHRIEARAIAGDRTSPTVAVTVTVPSPGGAGNGTSSADDRGIEAPENVTVSTRDGRFLVRWDPVADATAYHVQRDLGDGFETIARTTGTRYEDGTVPAGPTPRYRVVAEGPGGTSASQAVSAGGDPGPALALPVWAAVAGWVVAWVVMGRRDAT